MRLNRSGKRVLNVTIGPADRDPMFAPVWYDGHVELTPTQPELPLELPPLPQLQPPSANDLKWAAVIERANAVNAVLLAEPDFNGQVLVAVVCDLVDSDPTVDEIVAAYRKRMEAKRNG